MVYRQPSRKSLLAGRAPMGADGPGRGLNFWRDRMSGRRTKILVFLTMVALVAVCRSESITAGTDDNSEGGSTPLQRVLAAYRRGDSTEQRILHGADTTIEKNPWQVAIVAAVVPQ